MLVMKFGGTSVQDATALSRVLAVIERERHHAGGLVVVLSATSGTTDLLLRTAQAAGRQDTATVAANLASLAERHHAIVDALIDTASVRLSTHGRLDLLLGSLAEYCRGLALLGECSAQSLDEVASYGERCSTIIVAAACEAAGLRSSWFDVRRVMRTDERFQSAVVDQEALRTLCAEHLLPVAAESDVVITQGFVGATASGLTTTLGRGGSDYTGALLGAACQARSIMIWTDVSGIYTTDPRLVAEARPIPTMAFREVRELALYGAKVLHPETIAPAIDADIPVQVLNTFAPDEPGTTITATGSDSRPLQAVTRLANCLSVRTRQTTPPALDRFPTVLTLAFLEGRIDVVAGMTDQGRVDVAAALADVDHELADVAVLAVVGPQAGTIMAVARIADALRGLDVQAVASGISPVSTLVVCPADQAVDAVRRLHAMLDQAS